MTTRKTTSKTTTKKPRSTSRTTTISPIYKETKMRIKAKKAALETQHELETFNEEPDDVNDGFENDDVKDWSQWTVSILVWLVALTIPITVHFIGDLMFERNPILGFIISIIPLVIASRLTFKPSLLSHAIPIVIGALLAAFLAYWN